MPTTSTLANILSFFVIQESQHCYALHQTRSGVAQELAARLQCPIYPYVMLRCHEKVARFRRMVRGLFGNVISFGAVGVVPPASVCLAEYRIERLLHASVLM